MPVAKKGNKGSSPKVYQYYKNIYKINFKKLSTKLLKIRMYTDGGIPFKSLIQDSYVTPNITFLLKNKCECIKFDFKKIDVVS